MKGSSSQPGTLVPLPQALEAEEAIFGAMFINPGCRSSVRSNLEASDFYWEAHQDLFPVVTESEGDLVAIKGELENKGLLEKIGGKGYLARLADSISTSAAVRHHIKLVKEASQKRRLITLSQNLISRAATVTAEELAEYMRQGLNRLDLRDRFGLRRGVDIGNVFTAEKMLKEYSGYIETLKQNRFITGIHEVDKRIRGVAGGEVLFIIARAGSFKTALLQNLLKNYVQNSSRGAAFFSLEMPIPSVTERFQVIIQGSSGKEIEEHYTSKEEGAAELRKKLEETFIGNLRGIFTIPVKVSIPEIIQYVRLIEREYKTTVGVIGIDYLGLMDGQGQGEYEILSKLARDIKGMAKLTNLPVVVISQASRKAGTGEVEIGMDMGRGTGAIEEAADFAFGLFQAERPRRGMELSEEPAFDLILKILKNRKGGKGSRWKLDLNPENLRIGPDAEKWDPPKAQRKDVIR